jgi:hypothetical protein
MFTDDSSPKVRGPSAETFYLPGFCFGKTTMASQTWIINNKKETVFLT